MKNLKQKDIASKVGITEAMISYILSGKRRPSWTLAKKLASATKTKPEVWLDGTPEQIKNKIGK